MRLLGIASLIFFTTFAHAKILRARRFSEPVVMSCGIEGGPACGILQPQPQPIASVSSFSTPFNPSLSATGSFAQLGVTNPSGIPSFVRAVRDANGTVVFQAVDELNNVIAETRFSQPGSPFSPNFLPSTGLTSNGLARLNQVGVATPGNVVPAASVEPATLKEIANPGPGQVRGFVQQRPGEADATIQVVNANNLRVLQRVGNQFQSVLAQPGDLVVRHPSGQLVMVDNNVRDELVKHYRSLTNDQVFGLGGRAVDLVNLIKARHQALGATGGSTPTVGGSHTSTGSTGSSGTNRPTDGTPAKTEFQRALEKFNSIDGPADVDGFIRKWGFKNEEKPEDKTQHAVVPLKCVSPVKPDEFTKMAGILSRELVDPADPTKGWMQKIRVEKEFTLFSAGENQERALAAAVRADMAINAEQQAKLEKAEKLHRASRDLKGAKINYDLKIATTETGKSVWVKINFGVGPVSSEHYCKQDGPPLKTKPNDEAATPAPKKETSDSPVADKEKLKSNAFAALQKKCAYCHTKDQSGFSSLEMGEDGSVAPDDYASVLDSSITHDRMPKKPKDKDKLPFTAEEKKAVSDWLAAEGIK